ncbi:c-type cytochrome [Limnoglobus roseus]|uniref:Cytochrome c n=1 Tax=Limnoglobus roseus TaxID=2598579 RepID=A0A5C1A584_9BACT|nr:cytochrome c [Limnoglobus roseus]QEL13840.1 cytochrome c [Limnoglobus roseus]
MGDSPVLFPAHAAPPKLSRFRQGLVGLAPLALLAAWLAGGVATFDYASRTPPPSDHMPPPDGRALFIKHCAYCHGENGTGQGLAGLNPHARYFGRDKYKFTSTHKGDQGGLPTDADLVYTIRTGILGSAMPGFADKMTDDELRAVVAHVRDLSRAGLVERYKREADNNQEDPDWKDIAKKVEKESQPGEANTFPAFTPATPASVDRGRVLFVNTAKTACASCHGADGRGDGPGVVSDKKNDPPWIGGDGLPNKPRDLTSGVFKTGGEKAHLYSLIFYGIPGTPMPPHSKLSPREVEDLVDYVQSLGASAKK